MNAKFARFSPRPAAVGLGVFLAISSPLIVPGIGRALPVEITLVFPCLAAVIAGWVLAHQSTSPSHETRNALLLGILISLLLGLLNWLVPSDLPGPYYSLWISLLSLPVALFFVFAGTGLIGEKSPVTLKPVRNIASTLDRILSGQGETRYETCGWYEEDEEIFDLFAAAIRHVEQKLGAPGYSGKGGACSSDNGSDPGVFVSGYSHSLEIAWWRVDGGVFVILLSGHDANTLLCVGAEYHKIPVEPGPVSGLPRST